MNRLTLEEIAALSGVSRSTVSRVINDHPNVNAIVRERVQQVVQETGYQPNQAARTLAGRRSGFLGLFIPSSVKVIFDDPYFPRLIQGISKACNDNDYTMVLFVLHSPEEEERLYPKLIRTQLVDGVVLAHTQVGDPLIPKLVADNVPFVVVGQPDVDSASYVDTDNLAGSYTAVAHLVRRGYKCIATISGPMTAASGQNRRQGYSKALYDRGISIDDSLVVEGDYTEESGYNGMLALLPADPDAVFVASDTMALGAMRALRGAGKRVPEDIAIVGFDDLPSAAITEPPLTTVRQPIQRAGIQAVETLFDIIENGPHPPRRIIMPTELVIRETSNRAWRIGANG